MNCQLANGCVVLHFEAGGALHLSNLRSGSERVLNWPAFRLELAGEMLTAADCQAADPVNTGEALELTYHHEPTGVTVQVSYALGTGGFRKSLQVSGGAGLPTPARVFVDEQRATAEEVTITGFEALSATPGVVADQEGEETSCGRMPGCGYPVYVDDWFVGMEHPAAFTTWAGGTVQAYHHPTWEEGTLAPVPVVWGAAQSPETVRQALDEYIRTIRLPRLRQFLVSLCSFWSDPYVGAMEYDVSLEGYRAYLRAMLKLGVVPSVLTLDAGWNDRRSLLHFKNDPADSALLAFAEEVRAQGLDLSLWISRNGPMGMDPDWAASEGYAIGQGIGAAYSGERYLVMLDRKLERDLGDRLVDLTAKIGATHFKIDWDNECATNADFDEIYPTPDHVREESLNSWFRLEDRMLAENPAVVTRDGWWPSPWLLAHGSHLCLPASGDCEYSSWPARTQRDRAINHRDAMYHKALVIDRSPVSLDCFDNHEFSQAPRNPVQEERQTWLDNLVLTFGRGTSYITLFLNPESLQAYQAEELRETLAWARHHAPELLTDGGRMVLGDPARGQIYGFLNPSAGGAWLVLRNPSVEPQSVSLDLAAELGYAPAAVWQVYPYWERVTSERRLLGHEVVLLRAFARDPGELSPLPGQPFLVRERAGQYDYLFPGSRPLTAEIGPEVAPLMQIPELAAESFVESNEPGCASRQWFVSLPYRMQQPQLLVTLTGPQAALDQVDVTCSTSRYNGGRGEHFPLTQRVRGKDSHGYGTRRFLPPLGERTRDDYLFNLPAGGRVSVTVEVQGEGAGEVQWQAWLTGWEAPARQALTQTEPPLPGPQLPPHPYGFARSLRLL